MKNELNYNLKEIEKIRIWLKRSWFYSMLSLFLLLIFIILIIIIEVVLTNTFLEQGSVGFPPELENIVPIFYIIFSIFILLFVIIQIFSLIKSIILMKKNSILWEKMRILVCFSFILPFILIFITIKKINDYRLSLINENVAIQENKF